MGHNCVLLTLTVLLPFMFAATMVFNGLASVEDTGIYVSNTGDISDKYYLEITPSGWTFSIWGFIYTWQALWIVYAVINLFRKTEKGPRYTSPVLMPAGFLVVYLINLCLNIAWMILFDREQIEAAFAVLALMCVTLYICLFFSYRSLDRSIDTLIEQDRKSDAWLTRLLVHNGLSMYLTWCSVATLLNLAMTILYRSESDLSNTDVCSIVLGILAFEIVVFLVADFVFLDKFTRYTFTPYIVLIVALTGSLVNNYEDGARNSIFTVALLAVSGAAAVVKVVLLFWRHCTRTQDGIKAVTFDGIQV